MGSSTAVIGTGSGAFAVYLLAVLGLAVAPFIEVAARATVAKSAPSCNRGEERADFCSVHVDVCFGVQVGAVCCHPYRKCRSV